MKKKKFTDIQIRFEKQQRWKQFTYGLIARSSSGTLEGGRLSQSCLNAWWGTIKRDSARSLEIQKFNEAFWRAAFYSFIWLYGIWVGARESWLFDMRAIWGGWPLNQVATPEVKWYYMLSFGHYVHLFVTQFFEPKRKDWWEMFIHHIVTMLLIFFSWIVNFARIGVVVLLCHDGSDIFLEVAKIFNYLKYGTLCDTMFSLFALAFFVGRLVLYPWRVVYVALAIGAEQVGIWRGFYIFVGLLFMLQLLHIFWFYTIMCMVYSFVATGGVEKDVREETESEAEEVTGESKEMNNASNNNEVDLTSTAAAAAAATDAELTQQKVVESSIERAAEVSSSLRQRTTNEENGRTTRSKSKGRT